MQTAVGQSITTAGLQVCASLNGKVPAMPLNMGLKPLTAALLLCTLLVVEVNGHGYMSVPPARNWYGKFGTIATETYTPQGGNGQGSPGALLPGSAQCSYCQDTRS